MLYFMALLACYLLVQAFLIVKYQREFLEERERAHTEDELYLIETAALEALVRHDYVTVETLIHGSGKENSNIVSMSFTTPNGFLVAAYGKDTPPSELGTFKLVRDMVYGGNLLGRIELVGDYSEAEDIIDRLVMQLLAGSVLMVAVLGVALWYSQQKTAIEPLMEEIALRERAEAALALSGERLQSVNRELEAFAYSVSHDLRSPLRAVDGFSQALLEDCSTALDEDCKGYVERIRRGCQRMERLIGDLLMLSRITRATMKPQPVDLSRLAHEVLEELSQADPQRQVSVYVQEGMSALADIGLLRQVLANLLGNAWKFTSCTPAGRVEFLLTEHEGREAYCVRDNGAGFDMQYRDKLFGPFQRLHSEKEFSGTGIGLATVQRIIDKHGGTVWAHAEPGKGAAFYFTLGKEEGKS